VAAGARRERRNLYTASPCQRTALLDSLLLYVLLGLLTVLRRTASHEEKTKAMRRGILWFAGTFGPLPSRGRPGCYWDEHSKRLVARKWQHSGVDRRGAVTTMKVASQQKICAYYCTCGGSYWRALRVCAMAAAGRGNKADGLAAGRRRGKGWRAGVKGISERRILF